MTESIQNTPGRRPATPMLRNVVISIPLLFATLIPYLWLGDALGFLLEWKIALLGALGWWIALLLRIPVILLAKDRPEEQGRRLIVSASGPAEEGVRLAFLLWLGFNVDNAWSLGFGWAAIEIVYAVVQGFGLAALAGRDDEKAVEAREMLKRQGTERALEPSAPFWGIPERLSANAIHIAFSLLLLISPWIVLLTAPLHSALNLIFMRLLRFSFPAGQGGLAAIASTCLLVALWLVY